VKNGAKIGHLDSELVCKTVIAAPTFIPRVLTTMAQFAIPPPAPMEVSGDVTSNWKLFKASFEDYAVATKLTEQDEAIRLATFRSVLGKEARIILQHLSMTEDNRKKLKETIKALEDYFLPSVNVVYERYIFRCAVQQSETFDVYLAKLRKLASSCSYGALE
jgi:hypothetical protein